MSVEARWHGVRASVRIACASLFVAACACAAAAQVISVTGKVTLKQADGSVAPVAGAQIDIYRTDIQQKFDARTDKQGKYMYAGIPFVGTYTIAVSAPGAAPTYRAGLRLSQQPEQDFELSPGDGSRLTLEQIKAAGVASGSPGGATPREGNEARAARAELERKNAEIEEQNRKITADNEVVQRAFDAGNAALTAASSLAGAARVAKYDEAAARYDEGLRVRPDEPALLANKSVALRARGVERYNAAVNLSDDAAKSAGLEVGKKDFRAAADLASKAVEAINSTNAPQDAAGRAAWASVRYSALAARAEALRLAATKADQSRGEEAAGAYLELAAAETDPAKRLAARVGAGRVLYDVGQLNRAAEELRKVLADDPSNVEANLYLGMALFTTNDKAYFKEAAAHLQRFLNNAPPAHPMREDAKAMLEYLKAP